MNRVVYSNRRDRTAARLRAIGADAALVSPSRTLQYLTGHHEPPSERHFMLLIPANGDPEFLVPDLAATQLRTDTSVAEIRTWSDDDDSVTAVAALLADHDSRDGHLLVEDTMWARVTQDLREAAPAATWGLASEAIAELRRRKDESELAALRKAAAVADAVVDDLRALGEDAVGMTEAELTRWIDDRLQARGGTEPAFDTIVAAGPNGANPHHHPGDQEIRAGTPVVCDFGTRIDDYPSDQTRTLAFGGDPPTEYQAIHEVVREAQAAAIDVIEPGVPAHAVDRAAREVITATGYGDAFVHRTGHGVGLDVHEPPFIVADNDQLLEAGMVFSVEPGIYREGQFGCRIEDLVVVTDDDVDRLNTTDRGWQ